MASKDNSVNITSKKKRGYHHGDLRAALIAAGLELLKDRDADDAGLREAARAVGVSATAVYRHFPDKGAFLAALAAEGTEQLAAMQRKKAAAAGGGKAGFAATGAAYVRFAVDNPALFRLINSCAPPADLLEAPPERVGSAMRGLREDIARLTTAELSPAERKAAALRAWSVVHGLAMLILDRKIGYDPALVDAVISGLRFGSGGGEE